MLPFGDWPPPLVDPAGVQTQWTATDGAGGKTMNSLHWPPSILEAGLRWVARLLAVALIGLVLWICVGEGRFNPAKLTPIEGIQVVFLLTAGLRLVLAWR